ncbi:hypothetical protein Tco_1371966, partial [Tanacetum coccineum]
YELGESSAAAATRPIGGRRTDYGFVGTMDTEIRRRRAKEVGYGIKDVWIDPREAIEEATYQRQVQLTKALELLKGLQTQMAEFQRQLGPAKGLLQSVKYYGLFPASRLYRSFVLFNYPV